ncbi:hypothetical protein D4764_07G0000850 [Takifugu flavidus]|uniref:DUF4371 domain-containing protein n=1 Tax=Takifugu flavidus TaxID=433684 RepID=A0A5C6MQH2_9TELE|nr:hypothetical protein D4764_07G0000850 [Takifugu flavidus]
MRLKLAIEQSQCFHFMRRWHLSIRARTTVAQRLPADYQERVATFRTYCRDKITAPSHIHEAGAGKLCHHMRVDCRRMGYDTVFITDITDIAQLAIFIRGVDKTLTVSEEFLELVSMTDTTTAEDIFCPVVGALDRIGADWSRAVSLATDGAPSMIVLLEPFYPSTPHMIIIWKNRLLRQTIQTMLTALLEERPPEHCQSRSNPLYLQMLLKKHPF